MTDYKNGGVTAPNYEEDDVNVFNEPTMYMHASAQSS